MGDCNGIGLEILAKAVIEFDKKYDESQDIEFHIAGNLNTITEYYDIIDMPIFVDDDRLVIGDRKCKIIDCKTHPSLRFGKESSDAGKLAGEAIEIALEKTLNKEYDALVTMPVSKAALYLADWEYPGHTEMLAARCNIQTPLMILCTRDIRITLATIHEAISDVPGLINEDSLIESLNLFNNSLSKDFGIDKPKIAVLSLNPHAGEAGSMGKEEIEIISPAIEKCKDEALMAYGPYPADGFFAHGEYKNFDGILAMYHDQGLIPLKILAQGGGINFTGGLPIVRTSPDHGTAFQIAGKNIAESNSVLEAIVMAVNISKSRSR